MIDFENQIFNDIAQHLRAEYSDIFVVGEAVQTTNNKFPAVSIIQKSNINKVSSVTTDCYENHAIILFEVEIYCNSTTGKKQEAKEICNSISDKFLELGFGRTFCQPIDNLSDTTIYRIKARFQATIEKNGLTYLN